MKAKLLAFLVLIFVLLLIIISWLILYNPNKSIPISNFYQTSPSPIISPRLFRPTDPAKMMVSADQTRIEWYVSGRFISTPKLFGDFVVADFAVAGDTANFPLAIYFGPNDQSILLGRLDDADNPSQLVWTNSPTTDLIKQVSIGTPAEIYFLYTPNQGDYTQVLDYNQFWQDINDQIAESGKITRLTISPPQLWLYSNKIKLL